MPNPIAYLVLFSWPLVAWMMYRRMPLERAFVWTIIGGYLILPPATEVDLPLLPPIDKLAIANLSAFFLTITVGKTKVELLPRSWAARILVLIFVFMTIPTILTNGDTIIIDAPFMDVGPMESTLKVLPGMVLREVISFSSIQIIIHLLPFLVAHSVLASPTGRRELLRALMIGGLIYTIPSLFEIRFSPQINIWVYGFFQHNFQQMIRGFGFRPIVFLPHALWLVFFLVNSAIAAAALSRTEPGEKRNKHLYAVFWLMAVIVLCQSMGSTIYMLLLVPFIFMSTEAGRMRAALMMVILALAYPSLRNAGLIPLDDLVEMAGRFSADRAQSLGFRFDNEEVLLQHAHERLIFGWGGWGRNLTFSEWDGTQEVIPDGRWILTVGTYGLVGFFAEFGLLALPVYLIWLRRKHPPEGDDLTHAGTLALLLGVTLIDMLINSPIVPYVWMIAGALVGTAERAKVVNRGTRAVHSPKIDIKPVDKAEPRTII